MQCTVTPKSGGFVKYRTIKIKTMTLKEAISILSSHQKWRLGDEDTPMTVPSELTDAIATILDHIGDTNKMVEISDQDIERWAASYVLTAFNDGLCDAFKQGAKWYREQLRNRK